MTKECNTCSNKDKYCHICVDDSEFYSPLPGPVAPLEPVTPTTMTAPRLLQKASDLMTERAREYDKPEGERSMGRTVEAFNAITGRDLKESEGWLLMVLLKKVRLFQSPTYHKDSAEDAIAYAALLAEAKQNE